MVFPYGSVMVCKVLVSSTNVSLILHIIVLLFIVVVNFFSVQSGQKQDVSRDRFTSVY